MSALGYESLSATFLDALLSKLGDQYKEKYLHTEPTTREDCFPSLVIAFIVSYETKTVERQERCVRDIKNASNQLVEHAKNYVLDTVRMNYARLDHFRVVSGRPEGFLTHDVEIRDSNKALVTLRMNVELRACGARLTLP